MFGMVDSEQEEEKRGGLDMATDASVVEYTVEYSK